MLNEMSSLASEAVASVQDDGSAHVPSDRDSHRTSGGREMVAKAGDPRFRGAVPRCSGAADGRRSGASFCALPELSIAESDAGQESAPDPRVELAGYDPPVVLAPAWHAPRMAPGVQRTSPSSG